MAAWCPVRRVVFRVSVSELPTDLPDATRHWVRGFLSGNVPHQPVFDDDEDPAVLEWVTLAERFLATGRWPPELGDAQQRAWFDDARVLRRLGEMLAEHPLPIVDVRIPADLADQATTAWARDDDGVRRFETRSQRAYRRQAADLALIGLDIETNSRRDGNDVVVALSADLIVAAIRAYEERV